MSGIEPASPSFTVFCRDASGTGTTYITAVCAPDIETAKHAALCMCMHDWGRDSIDEIAVIGVASGEVQILEWDDGGWSEIREYWPDAPEEMFPSGGVLT